MLIIYDSRYGQTARIATRLAEHLRAMSYAVEVADTRSRSSPEHYDVIVIGAPIYAGRFRTPIRRWLRHWREAIVAKPTAFFIVSATAASSDPAARDQALAVGERFFESLHWHPQRQASFAGGLPYASYGTFTRLLMRWIVGRAGGDTDTSRNYEYTDWEAVRRFAEEISQMADSEAASQQAL